jgi:hypothetical protein
MALDDLLLRSRHIEPGVPKKYLRVAVAAFAFVALTNLPTELSAQTVMPSQVTPPTLRPPTATERSLGAHGTEDLEVLPDKRGKAFRKNSKTRIPTTGGKGQTPGIGPGTPQ